jgi:hypothetical protein
MDKIGKRTDRASRREYRRAGHPDQYGNRKSEWRQITIEGDLVLEVDIYGLLHDLGQKALRSKGGLARECRGLVKVTACKRREISVSEWQEGYTQ